VLLAVSVLALTTFALAALLFRLLGEGAACPDAVPWHVAQAREGELLVMRGDVVGALRDPESVTVILDVGLQSPDPERLSVVIVDPTEFPDDPVERFSGEAICVRGTVKVSEGVATIVVDDQSDLWLDQREYRRIGSTASPRYWWIQPAGRPSSR
jgi:hypothetical protein